jgi:transcriptional regulator with XRE-family HTH domain
MAPAHPSMYQARVVELGRMIREYRRRKGLNQSALGKDVALSHSAISHFEKGRHIPRRDVARRIDKALDADGRILKLRDQLDDNPDAPRWLRFFRYQSDAQRINQIGNVVPAMLETEEYTRITLRNGLPFYGGCLDDKIAYRAEMRTILHRSDPPQFACVIGEAALHVMTGSEEVMHRQLAHLIELSEEPNIDVRILPYAVSSGLNDAGTAIVWDLSDTRKVAWRDTHDGQGSFVTGTTGVSSIVGFYDHVRSRAFDPEESRSFIRKLVEELYPCRSLSLTCP